MYVNIEKLETLTGTTRRTILKRCESIKSKQNGRAVEFESKDALPLIYQVGQLNHKSKTLEEERTRLASAQANKTELDVLVMKKELLPATDVEEVVNNMVSAFKAKILSIPPKLAPVLSVETDTAVVDNILKESMYEALQELSNYDSEQYSAPDDKQDSEVSSTPTKADSKRVGRPKPKTKPRVKRRARSVANKKSAVSKGDNGRGKQSKD